MPDRNERDGRFFKTFVERNMSENPHQNRVIPVTKWPEEHPWPSIAGLRHLIHFESENGFNTVVRRIGGRVLIDETAFFAWVERSNAPKRKRRQRVA